MVHQSRHRRKVLALDPSCSDFVSVCARTDKQICCSPISICRIRGCPIAERMCSPLVCHDPNLRGCVIEKRRRDCRAIHAVLAGCGHIGPVGEETKVHGPVGAIVDIGAVSGSAVNISPPKLGGFDLHQVLALVWHMGEVLQRCPVVHWLCERAIWTCSPLWFGRKVAVLSADRNCGGKHAERNPEQHDRSLAVNS